MLRAKFDVCQNLLNFSGPLALARDLVAHSGTDLCDVAKMLHRIDTIQISDRRPRILSYK
jgi:hypothetical protein